ncbi:MAG: class I SAM-dependent methyltransferase [Methylobacter sp.]|nr:class I SAM-dependent methyltransferase [Methylobacter sp.]
MSTQQQLAVTYDVSNDFFRLWLDKRMIYSCALFWNDTETLEEAQLNKLKWFYSVTKLTARSRVIDIGCGWGGSLQFLYEDMKVADVTGITLSRAQYLQAKQNALWVENVYCQSYLDHRPIHPYDVAISIGMFEHLATPHQARTGESLDIYRNYFRLVWEWTRPGALFGLQSVISARIPRHCKTLQDLAWATQQIFPGAVSPRLEAIITTLLPYWEVIELHTRREHYEKTSTEWLRRLSANKSTICKQWGEATFFEYERYLATCVEMFGGGYQSLVQMVLRRIDRER